MCEYVDPAYPLRVRFGGDSHPENLSSTGGDGSIIYESQLIRDTPVGGIGDFHTVRGGINPDDISVFVPGLSELYICEWIMILGMDPIVPR